MKSRKAMRVSRLLTILAFLSFGLGITFAKADQSEFVNAKLETRAISQRFEATLAQIAAESQQPVWVAYEVQSIGPDHSVCCGNYQRDGHDGYCGTCNLEQQRADSIVEQNQNKTIKLEALSQLTVLLRLDQKRVMRIRVASSNCTLDAGGLRVVWLTGVKPEESVAFLTQLVIGKAAERDGDNDLSQQALMAVAQHADPSADRAFASFVTPDQPASLRDKTAFWLGASRGKPGLSLLEKMAKNDPSSDVRAKVAFALSVSHEPGAVDAMIRMAKDDADSHVRGQALFWLAQKAGQKASTTITSAIQNDPDTEVKKKAVFALSQMPTDEGVPKLIEVAQNNRNPEVRKQAMFWLGQSHDPRALAFFEKILSQ
jgi:HEAT repeat protein